jgi:hypothetical protein
MTDVVMTERGLKVCLDEGMDFLVLRKDVSAKRVYISHETWDALNEDDDALAAFEEMARERIGGFRVMPVKAQPFAAAVERWRAGAGALYKDRLAALLERAQGLVADSASAVASGADPSAVTQVMEAHAVARRDLQVLAEEVEVVKALLDLAGRAVCGV